MSDSESSEINQTPPEVRETAEKTTNNLLPQESKEKYLLIYNQFIKWKNEKKVKSLSENVLLAYFTELPEKLKASTLWSRYSMLKMTIKTNDNIDIGTYGKLNAFLKRKSTGFVSKKSKTLSADECTKFLTEAPDQQYLATKVALIFGIIGALRKAELCNIMINDIKDHMSHLLITIPKTKTHIPRTFIIEGEFYYNLFKKYEALRPQNINSGRFFLNDQNGKCTHQVIGINKFANMPKQIATYLKLSDPQLYTGHTFRRTSATLLANSGADITVLKRHGGWKSNQVAEGYVEDSVNNKRKICNQITESLSVKSSSPTKKSENKSPSPKRSKTKSKVNFGTSTSKVCDSEDAKLTKTITNSNKVVYQFTNCSNLTIQNFLSEDGN